MDSPAKNEIIGSPLQDIYGNKDQFHLFLIAISRLILSSSSVTILVKLCIVTTHCHNKFLFYHYFIETKDKFSPIQESQNTVKITYREDYKKQDYQY